jgi:hypothetical protein
MFQDGGYIIIPNGNIKYEILKLLYLPYLKNNHIINNHSIITIIFDKMYKVSI